MRTTLQRAGQRVCDAFRDLRLLTLGCALLLFVLVVTGCTSAPTARTSTPTPTLTSAITPTPTQPGITRLSAALAAVETPSPDGTMLAGADSHPVAVTIYTVQGKILARVTAPPNNVFFYRWLPDSSGLLIWSDDPSGTSGPISILSPQGSIQSTGLPSLYATPSPDISWIASEVYNGSPSLPSAVEVAPRHGGAVRTLVSGVGVTLLGWQGANVVYSANGAIYAISQSEGTAHLLVSEGGVAWGPPDGLGPTISPDGQVLFLFERHQGFARLVGAQVLKLPSPILELPIIWAGPHQAIGVSGSNDVTVEGEVMIVDMVSGAVVQDTGTKAPVDIQALSGDWLGAWAQAASGQPETLHFTNLSTKREVDLGPPPTGGGFYSLGQGRFFLNGNGESYLLDPAAALAS
jgi:hypothetical protein